MKIYNRLGAFGKFILLAIVGGLILGIGLSPFALAFNQVKTGADDAFANIQEANLSGALSSPTTLYANDGKTELATFYTQDRIVVKLSDISVNLQHAVIAREDQRFYQHHGIDIRGTLRALVQTSSGNQQGGSTLTQQYVKNVLIDQALQEGDPIGVYEAKEDSLMRKIKEAKYAFEVEQKMTKNQILEGYLNVVPFGPNVYGAEASARHYFSKSAKDLTIGESALIACITKSPSVYNPLTNPDVAQEQRDLTLKQMRDQGYITENDYEIAKAQKVVDMLHPSNVPTGCKMAVGEEFFCDYVINEILNDPQYGETKQIRQNFINRGGLKITTTLDLTYQKHAQETVSSYIPADDASGIAAAMTTVEPGTGKVLAMAQNKTYDPSATQRGSSTAINYNVGLEEGGSRGFSPGSTMKVVTLSDWLKHGHSLNESLPRLRYPFMNNTFACNSQSEYGWSPKNADGGKSTAVPLIALEKSWNIPFIQMGQVLGLCSISQTAKDMGFVDSLKGDITNPKYLTPQMIIGNVNATPLTMANTYATVASGGIHCNPVGISKIINSDDVEIPSPDPGCSRVLEQNVANTLQYAFKKSVTNGLANGEGIGSYDVGGKTGTSDEAWYLWSIGFLRQSSTAVFVGNPDWQQPLKAMRVGKVYYGGFFYPGLLCIPMFRSYMTAVTNDLKLEHLPFGEPDQSLIGYKKASSY
ncbi:MAG: penicillin-binding protein [Candidatus Ancillula sp.]|jgi:membrane peptidoglycan carboxypeptidase|nr:penicillin-binding protein [Candidatus Ancillula sp.]